MRGHLPPHPKTGTKKQPTNSAPHQDDSSKIIAAAKKAMAADPQMPDSVRQLYLKAIQAAEVHQQMQETVTAKKYDASIPWS